MNQYFATYLIGLREGLEATLVVTVLVAFLVKSDRRDRLPLVWAGVGAALAFSILFGWLLTFTGTNLLATSEQRELFEAITSIAAVVFVTWMIFWMRRAARSISGELRARLDQAILLGRLAVILTALLAVVREGLETALIFYSAAQGVRDSAGPLYALIAGVLTAVALGWLLYRGAVRVNLTRFFTWTGALLVLVAAGILKYAVHDLQEAGVLPGLNNLAFDISAQLDPSTWYAALLAGMFNVTPAPTVLEVVAWLAYGIPVLLLFLWPSRKPAPTRPPIPARQAAPTPPPAPARPPAPRSPAPRPEAEPSASPSA